MFTGIIEEIGHIKQIESGEASAKIFIEADKIMSDIAVGKSIATNGICLTVIAFNKKSFTVEVMHETFNCTNLGDLAVGSPVNLERAMVANGRFDGHIVSGHVDGLGTIHHIEVDDNAHWFTIQTTSKLLRYIVEKGSITIDGISLTVARVAADSFAVSIIPHTLQQTILGSRQVGQTVNLEVDIIGKYVEQLLA